VSSYTGVLKIMRFNWPWYVGAVLVTAAMLGALLTWTIGEPWAMLAWALVALADTWLLLSLVVSHVIYDRSAVARGGWLDASTATAVAIFHLGQDEASVHTARLLPAANRQTFDVFDPTRSGSPSLRRARALANQTSLAATLDQLPLADGQVDLGLVIFAAHEIRHDATRAVFFRELARIISPSGRVLVVEHLRDGWNLLAYGPGAFHFLSRSTWLRTFAQAGLRVAQETSLTPWVRRFELRRS
jgi:SAM-dependent methyltransferase